MEGKKKKKKLFQTFRQSRLWHLVYCNAAVTPFQNELFAFFPKNLCVNFTFIISMKRTKNPI